MLKTLKTKKNNKGNTFIVVMVTIATMGILVGVILATMGYFYRARMVDLNNKNNFYYLEKAMEDIYSGVGSRSSSALMYAYEETVQVLVYYDPATKRYKTVDEESANKMMKQKFLKNLSTNTSYLPQSQDDLYNTLKSFITVDGVELVDPNSVPAGSPKLYMEVAVKDIVDSTGMVTGQEYDKLVIRNVTVKRTTDDGYVQSITTDIEINQPQFTVSFSNVSTDSNVLYDYALVSDMGLEFWNDEVTPQEINITGNVYAAADYYNKEYNSSADTRVNSYDASKQAECRGITETSKYSGIYARATNLNITAAQVIVPGSISVIDNSNVKITGTLRQSGSYSEVWADNIVLAPSFTRTVGKVMNNGKLTMYADAYIADDMEVNSDDAEVTLVGNYYGYNFSQTSESQRVLAQYAESKNHTNSSAIIINGDNATLDLSDLGELYVAGRSYISTSTIRQVNVSNDNNSATTTYVSAENGTTTPNDDVQTGGSISVKPDQLAYMPYGVTTSSSGATIPNFTNVYSVFNEAIYNRISGWLDTSNPVMKETVSGTDYYFLNFKSADDSKAFFNWYANELPSMAGYELATDMVDVTKYADFTVADISVDDNRTITSGSYVTGALDAANSQNLTVMEPSAASASVNFNDKAAAYNQSYIEYKYALQEVSEPASAKENASESAGTVDLTTINSSSITPINYYIDMSKVNLSGWSNGKAVGTSYVWVSDDDITVTAPTGTNGKVTGMIITKGDVIFDNSSANKVTRFEGIIIAGGKIKANYSMSFVSNPELMKTILRTADATAGNTGSDDLSALCKIFRDYTPDSGSTETGTTNVGNIEIGDILQYVNWKKNVE